MSDWDPDALARALGATGEPVRLPPAANPWTPLGMLHLAHVMGQLMRRPTRLVTTPEEQEAMRIRE